MLKHAIKATSTELGNLSPHTIQACYLPIVDGGTPVMGPIPGISGAYIATGHSCWGITNGPASGEAMAALIMRASSSPGVVDLRPFYPKKL